MVTQLQDVAVDREDEIIPFGCIVELVWMRIGCSVELLLLLADGITSATEGASLFYGATRDVELFIGCG